MNRKAMMQFRKQQRQKPKSVKPEFTSQKKYKFRFFRKFDFTIGVKITTRMNQFDEKGKNDFNNRPIEELIEESIYDTSAEHLVLSRKEFNKLEKFLTPLPYNVSVEDDKCGQ